MKKRFLALLAAGTLLLTAAAHRALQTAMPKQAETAVRRTICTI